MITSDKIEKARKNWMKASKELGFKIYSPSEIFINGKNREVFAFLPEYGSLKGAIVELISGPEFKTDKELSDWARSNNYFCSFVDVNSFLAYNEEYFKDILLDWQILRE